MNKAVVDDFVIDRSRVVDVERKKDKIERLFSVVVSFGNVAPDLENREKQWVGLEGESDDRRNAKEYIVALCHPEDQIKMTVTPSLSSGSDEQLEKVEKQTRAAISVNDNCKIIISGTDLAVTLAMSAIEDLIERSGQAEQTDAVKGEPDKARKEKRLSSEAALRLDTRFERALSQHSDGSCTSKDYEYTADAVKRVMLQCWSDDNASGGGNSALPGSVETDAVASNGANLGASNSDMKTRSATPESNGARAAGSSGSKSDQPSSFITNLGKQVNEIKLESAKNLTSLEEADSGQPKSSASAFNLRDFAKQCGYQEEDIDAVLKVGPAQMTPKEFLTRLYENKAMKGTSQEPDSLLFSSGTGSSVRSKTNSISEIIQSKSDNFNPDRRRSSSEVFLSKEVNTGSPTAPLDNYWQRLARDFQEEDECTDINELKQRNAERQQLIKSVFTQQTQSQGNVNKSAALQNQVPSQQKPSKNKKKKGKNSAKPSPNLKQNGAVQSEKNSSPVFRVDLTSEDSADISGGKGESSSGFLVNLTDGSIRGSSAERQNSQVSGDFSETCLMEVWQPAILSNDGKASHRPHVQPYQNNLWPAHPPGYRQQLNSGWPVNAHVGGARGKHPMQTQRQLRHIIIDGSNVAMRHGNDKVFSCLGIKLCIDYFLKRGHTEVTAFVPQWRTRMPTPNNPQLRQDLLEILKDQGNLVFTPSRKVDGRHIVCYDDRFVLKLAEETDGVIVSNDNYRDLMMESPTWKKMIQERLLMYSFVGDLFMPPDDPLGRNGPTLDEYLCKQSQQPMNKKTRALSPQPLMSMRVGRPNFRYQNPGYVHQQQHGLLNFNPAQQQQQQQPRQVWNPKRNKPVPGRSQEETDHLATLLRSLFPNKEQEEKIYQVLQNHRSEKDINKLSNYIMNICPL